MKKIFTVMMIMMIAAVSVFAAANATSLDVTYNVAGKFTGAYTFKLNNGTEAETFNMGSNNGSIAASNSENIFYIVDRSFCNNSTPTSCTITIGDPSAWTNTSTSTIVGSDVSLASLTGIDGTNVTTSVSGSTLTITYAAATTVATVTNRVNTPTNVASFKLTWDESIVPVGSYRSTIEVQYTGI